MYKHLIIALLSVISIPTLGQLVVNHDHQAVAVETAQQNLSICHENCLDDRGSGRHNVGLPSTVSSNLSACTEDCGERGGGRRDQQYKTADQEDSLTKKRGSGRIDPDPQKLSA